MKVDLRVPGVHLIYDNTDDYFLVGVGVNERLVQAAALVVLGLVSFWVGARL